MVASMTWLTITEYLCHRCPMICSFFRTRKPALFSSFMTYSRNAWCALNLISTFYCYGILTSFPWRVPLVQQEVLILPEHMTSPVTQCDIVLFNRQFSALCFVDNYCLSFSPFSFGYCIVCPSIYRFWAPPFNIFKLLLMYLRISRQIAKIISNSPIHSDSRTTMDRFPCFIFDNIKINIENIIQNHKRNAKSSDVIFNLLKAVNIWQNRLAL